MKITDIITEAANSAQQAAKAISMKKAGKKPRQGVAEGSQEDAKFTPRFEVRSRIESALDQYLNPEQVAGGYTDIQYYKHDGRVYVEVLFNYTNGQKIGPTQRKRFLVNKDFTLTPIKHQQGVAEGSESDAYGNTGEKHECGSCDGTGIVSYDELAKAVEYDDECPECGGKGWVRDKESLKKKGVAEDTELAEEFDLIESIVEMIAEHNGVDADVVWADLESLTEDELYVFAVTSDPLMESEAWQKANKRDKTDGMSQKAVNTYRREHPGSKLKTAVTTKPSKLKKGSKASKRRKSYCSRSRGQMKMHSISCAKTPDKAICKARRRWNC